MQSLAGVAITNSTFIGNSSAWSGGAIALRIPRDSTAILVNCTIVSNYHYYAAADTSGGGLYITLASNAVCKLVNTIVAHNNGMKPDISGTCVTSGVNLIGNNLGANGLSVFDFQNVPANLGPLQDNGGPTPTCRPLANSLAIGNGVRFASPVIDQRGAPRPPGATCDIGAVQVNTVLPIDLEDPIERSPSEEPLKENHCEERPTASASVAGRFNVNSAGEESTRTSPVADNPSMAGAAGNTTGAGAGISPFSPQALHKQCGTTPGEDPKIPKSDECAPYHELRQKTNEILDKYPEHREMLQDLARDRCLKLLARKSPQELDHLIGTESLNELITEIEAMQKSTQNPALAADADVAAIVDQISLTWVVRAIIHCQGRHEHDLSSDQDSYRLCIQIERVVEPYRAERRKAQQEALLVKQTALLQQRREKYRSRDEDKEPMTDISAGEKVHVFRNSLIARNQVGMLDSDGKLITDLIDHNKHGWTAAYQFFKANPNVAVEPLNLILDSCLRLKAERNRDEQELFYVSRCETLSFFLKHLVHLVQETGTRDQMPQIEFLSEEELFGRKEAAVGAFSE